MARVICPGELLIDFICTDRDSSLANSVNFIKKAGGAPANVAVAITKMGVESSVLASVGNDQFGDFLITTMKKFSVNTDYIKKLVDAYTTMAFVSLQSDGERDFNFVRDADRRYSFEFISQDLLDTSTVFHFGSAMAFLEGELRETYYKLLEYAVEKKKIITFDPNYRDSLFGNNIEQFSKHSKNFIKHSHVVKVSNEEAEIITGRSDVEEAAKDIIKLGAKYVLVTLGKEGTLLACEENLEYIKSSPVKMVDATGAGDAFIGAFIAKLAKSEDLSYKRVKEYVVFGNKVGAETVRKYGALDSIPTLEELNKL